MAQQKIVLIGAGSLTFGMGTVGSILESEILEGSTICLHDINKENLELVHQACESAIAKKRLDFSLESTTERSDALKGATFIINSIEVAPRFYLLDLDYKIPLQHGCKQVTGENGGPGALFHSLRVIPHILDICEDVKKICPKAFFINYSNPVTRIGLAIKRKFPDLKTVGLCHEFYHFMPILARILGVKETELEVKGYGLNHFGVITKCLYKDLGKDAYPDIRKKGPEYLYNLKAYDGFKFIAFFLEKYGYLPYTTDSHYGEYIPWAWEKTDIPAIRRFWKGYEDLMNLNYQKLKKIIIKGRGAKLVKAEEEPGIPIIEGIMTDSNYMEPSVNIPNEGIIANLPQDLIIECPAIVSKEGVRGIKMGDYPLELVGYLKTQASVIDLVLEAIFQKSKDWALKAILADPLISTYGQAEKIFNDLYTMEKDYIPLELK
ncbi:MAG: alpha-glucosidase [Candidatus Lokiarchaeota archaeon]|nr:alpha-glucosidase [Candidatus Lokiarchaeota archaeon]MBD3338845.1 alpha-glucosidase [Candidatus Lokiarchaeota archaeon]